MSPKGRLHTPGQRDTFTPTYHGGPEPRRGPPGPRGLLRLFSLVRARTLLPLAASIRRAPGARLLEALTQPLSRG